MLHKFTYQLYK